MIMLEWMKILKAMKERHFRDPFFPSSDKQVPFWNKITREYNSFVLVFRSSISCMRGRKPSAVSEHISQSVVMSSMLYFCNVVLLCCMFTFSIDSVFPCRKLHMFQFSQPGSCVMIYIVKKEKEYCWFFLSWLWPCTPRRHTLAQKLRY